MCALQWQDIDFDDDAVRVLIRRAVIEIEKKLIVQGTKTHAVRNLGLDEETSRLLRELGPHRRARPGSRSTAATHGLHVRREPGSDDPLPPDRVGQAWQRLCKELGVKARLHDLRHLQASLLLDAGEAVTTVAARLGHRDASTTLKVYGHLPGADTRAAGMVGSALATSLAAGRPVAAARTGGPANHNGATVVRFVLVAAHTRNFPKCSVQLASP
ncbi:MAG: site-specific integrase [Actinomycetota bacterium]|nr:site-specific integrase [Actinomycetota bacterium]